MKNDMTLMVYCNEKHNTLNIIDLVDHLISFNIMYSYGSAEFQTDLHHTVRPSSNNQRPLASLYDDRQAPAEAEGFCYRW